MENVTVKVNVTLATALSRGSAHYGVSEIQLTDADVAQLSEGARAELAGMRSSIFAPIGSEGEDLNYNHGPLDVDQADASHVLAELEARATTRAAHKREASERYEQAILAAVAASDSDWIRKFDGPSVLDSPAGVYLTDRQKADPRIVARRRRPSLLAEVERIVGERAAKQAEEQAAKEAEKKAEAERARASRIAQSALVNDHGTPDQRERFAAGVLPRAELDTLVRSVLFLALADLPVYQRKTSADIQHDDDCDDHDCDVSWVTETVANPELTDGQWTRLKRAREAAALIEDLESVDVVEHTAKLNCRCADPVWLAARVTVEWAGQTYKQSYEL